MNSKVSFSPVTESHKRSNAVTVCDCEPSSFHRHQKSVLQTTHFELPSRDWEWLVREGNMHLSLPFRHSCFSVYVLNVKGGQSVIGGQGFMFMLVDVSQVILAEVLCDCSSSQAVVKELRVSASPLEQRKFLAESEPYRLDTNYI